MLLLEARDLLFARLLQYRAFKEVSAWFGRSLVRDVVEELNPDTARLDDAAASCR